MRTNIVLDDALVKRAQQLTGIHTKREVVDAALRGRGSLLIVDSRELTGKDAVGSRLNAC